jgi:hypothetical protein
MRIKFNDKIYRLKEVESGVDSLMELVEESKHKHGDFLMTDNRIAFILDREGVDGEAYHLFCTDMDGEIRSHMQDRKEGVRYCGYLKHAVLADSEATEAIHYGLKSIGKRWNAEKKCIEDIPVYNDGDFVVSEFGSILIFKEADGDRIFDHAYLPSYGELIIDKVAGCYGVKRHATTEEKQRMIEALAKKGKRWNDNKKCVEDIPKRKFKAGDKVKIKDGISSETHRYVYPHFTELMDEFIGKELTVKKYSSRGFVVPFGDYFHFAEDWLEPWSDEPKVGDWVVAWDVDREAANVGILEALGGEGEVFKYVVNGFKWMIAVKWDGTIEHLEKIRKG